MNALVQGSLLHEIGQRSLAKYLEYRPSTALFYDLYEASERAASASKVEDYTVACETALRSEMRSMASAIRKQIEPGIEADWKIRLQALSSQLDIFAGYTDAPVGYIDTWAGHIPFIINQINGPLIDIPEALANSFAVTSEADAIFYVQRLTSLSHMIASVVDKFEHDRKQGWYAPDTILARAVDTLKCYISSPFNLHPLYASFEHKLKLCEAITVDSRLSFLNHAESVLKSSIYPAYSVAIDTVERFLSSDHAPVYSVLDLPGGSQYYQNALRYQANSLDGTLLHQFGLEQIEAINHRLARSSANFLDAETTESYLLRRSGRSLESFDFTQALLSYLEELNERARALADDCVKGVNLEDLSFKAIPPALEASAPFAKYTPAGKKTPAIFWVNAAKVRQMPISFLEVVAFHETVPGHHLQFCVARQNHALPVLLQLSLFNTFIEGWATYAEGLASTLQLYTDAVSGENSHIRTEQLRAARVVADTGLHAKGWTRNQGITFLEKTAGLDTDDAAAEIDRYLAVPAQAAGYQVGLATIRKLHSDACAKYGNRFDLSRFNATLLSNGAVPFSYPG
ncbi:MULTISPECIES: DUF885 domain-containing protein [Pseudomonas]|uniref:DUF885 domain-containing protein n=1 Tax=Pseudomonas TaxID=286 RepID=UPI000710844D|nr:MULTISPECIES: DUF885 domain-containing protein [Pseudomonas]KQW33016.1 hypothetical protein ASC85_23675 [Pseudomonas sp. Root401]WHS56203.1 DUF885 domain-containing protein [Pseudomonas brassicacearum]